MIAFAWQSMLLLGLAYVLGCWIGCLARRMMGTSAELEAPEAIPAGAIASAAAAGAVSARPPPAPLQPPRQATLPAAVPVRDAFRRADTLEPQPEAASRPPQPQQPQPSSRDSVARFERALGGPHAGSGASQSSPASTPSLVANPPAGQRLPAGQASRPADDLKRIRSIDQGVEAALHRIGVRTFAEIGAWKPADVARVSHALGVKGRIEQQNWIEQAQILASGKETHYSSGLHRGDRPDVVETARAASEPRPMAPPASPPPRSIAPGAPSPSPAMTARSTAPVSPVRSQKAEAEATATAAAMAAAAAAARMPSLHAANSPAQPSVRPTPASPPVSPPFAKAPEPEAKPSPAATVSPPVPTGPAAPSAAPRPVVAEAQSEPQRPAVPARDGLQRIGGITPEIEKLLYAQGIVRYGQIAQWITADVERFDRLLGHQGRIAREKWVEQAAALVRGGETDRTREHDRPPNGTPGAKPAHPVARVLAPSQSVPSAGAGAATTSPAPPPPTMASISSRPDFAPPLPPRPPEAARADERPITAPVAPTMAIQASEPTAQIKAPPAAKPVVRVPALAPAPTATTKPLASEVDPVTAAETAAAAVAALAVTRAPAASPTTATTSVPTIPGPSSLLPSLRANERTVAAPRPSDEVADTIREKDAPARLPDPSPATAHRPDDAPRSQPARTGSERGSASVEDAARAGEAHDLKRIRGIGVLIEKKLNSMGVTRYQQIAEWTVADIERVSHVLDFKGRIERENWVEQARILASGGQTEFSRRADRGEIGGF